MIGLIDVGGGMRGIYTSGVYDFMLDNDLTIDYGIGVSAGAANMITYLAKQPKRTLKFFSEYTFRKEYMGVGNWLKSGNYLNLDYIYTTLTVRGSEYPLDYETFLTSTCPFYIVATNAQTGKPEYFTRDDMAQDQYDVLKASCAIPAACKPYPVNEGLYFDGGVADPVPYKKALADGCDKLIVLLTRPLDYQKPKQKNMWLIKHSLRKYPRVIEKIEHRHEVYNQCIVELKELAAQGKVLLVAPDDCCGVSTLTKDKDAFLKLYQKGYEDGEAISKFLNR